MRGLSEGDLFLGWSGEIQEGVERGLLHRCPGGRAAAPQTSDGFGLGLTRREVCVATQLYQYNFCSRQTLLCMLDRCERLDDVIHRIRRKLPRGAIECVRGAGYRLTPTGRLFVAGLLGKDDLAE